MVPTGTSVSAARATRHTALSLLRGHSGDSALIEHHGRLITAGEFLSQARALADSLPEHAYVFNLCNDRYHFILLFAAALLRGQSNLLPPNQAPLEIKALAARYPDAYCALDARRDDLDLKQVCIKVPPTVGLASDSGFMVPDVDAAQLAAVVFTSGSSGESQANTKTWGELVSGSRMAQTRFIQASHAGALVIATVPAQHMFGLETSVLMPLLGGLASHSGRPFFPADVHAALNTYSGPRILISTPLHLKACMEAGLTWPKIDLIISATAPLSMELAQAAENAFQCPLREIYGCTEAGSLASRRTVAGPLWHLYEGMRLMETGAGWQLDGPQLAHAIILGDELRLESDGRFELLGRHGDMLKIAGKRASLAGLNQILGAIAGVEDGVILAPDSGDESGRLCALVVAPNLSSADVHAALANHIDAVFLPRPIFMVAALPRNATGKLPRQAVLDLLKQVRGRK